jgi:hypothetical protein
LRDDDGVAESGAKQERKAVLRSSRDIVANTPAGTIQRVMQPRALVVIVIVVPVLLGFPAMILSVPPLVILIPTVSTFGVQIPAAVFGLVAVIAMITDGSVEVGLRLFDGVLAVRPVIGVRSGCCCYE